MSDLPLTGHAGQPLLTLPPSDAQVLSIRAKALVFNDPRSRALLGHMERIAPSEATVLIVGETGTGKELVARHIHERSGRGGPFVAINCGAFSDNLIDAELFGHEAGAFTGARTARAGWFEAADRGTLFLDEIGDMPLALQVKLLRVLQERQVVRVGSRRPVQVDVRLVAATNVDLGHAVEAGHFRRDLYYRLNVACLSLPPLRQRIGDILPLAAYFLGLYAHRLGRGTPVLSAAAQRALLDYPWPGNIRELENVVHCALLVSGDAAIEPEHLKLTDGLQTIAEAEAQPPIEAIARQLLPLFDEAGPQLLARLEGLIVERAFAYSRFNQVRTAKLLGVTRNVVRTLLKRHGLIDVD